MAQRQRVPSSGVKADVGDSLGLQLYVVHSKATELKSVKENLPAHREYLRDLEDRNVLFAAGPLWTSDGEFFEGDGLLIYRADSVEAARAYADADPMHSSDARAYEITPWMLNDGAFNLRVVLSRQIREVN